MLNSAVLKFAKFSAVLIFVNSGVAGGPAPPRLTCLAPPIHKLTTLKTAASVLISKLCPHPPDQRRSVGGAVGYICPRAPRYRGAKMGRAKISQQR